MKNDKRSMKIMAGMGSVDDYPSYVAAGVDEIFIGYVPHRWVEKYGTRLPLNRREVLYYNVQIGSYSELEILRAMVDYYHVPVTIAINSLSYPKACYEDILDIIKECEKLDFKRFIMADPGLIEYVCEQYQKTHIVHNETCEKSGENDEQGNQISIIVSGEYGEMNESILEDFSEKGITRVIFPRQTTLTEMRDLICKFPQMEYEAFALNEKCHFTGAYCNSMHCDEMCHMCKVEYRYDGECVKAEGTEVDVPGFTGCGLCALWEMRAAGVTHLKLVSRGNGSDETIEDIGVLKKALEILDQAETKEDYIIKMKASIFPDGCSGNCYYLD